jgi:hypothetical protein
LTGNVGGPGTGRRLLPRRAASGVRAGVRYMASLTIARALFSYVRQETSQCRADIGLSRRIGPGAPTREGRANRRKGQHPIKLAGSHSQQRSDFDPSDGAQGKQQRGLKAVACPDGTHHICCGRLDLNQTRQSVPCLSSLDPTRDDEQAHTRRNK